MAGRYNPPPLGPYQYHEVLSALRKEIKLNNPEDAIYWANVILTYTPDWKTAQRTVVTQLWIMSAEDIDDPAIIQRVKVVQDQVGKVQETDQIFYLIAQMCRARKWWEHEEGRNVDMWWGKAIGDLKDPDRQKPIPSYALDRHTRRGWGIFRKTGRFDDRYSGTDLGRQKTSFLFQRDGDIDPALSADWDPTEDEQFKKHWGWFRNLMGLRKGDLEPNDPIGPVDLYMDDRPSGDALFDVNTDTGEMTEFPPEEQRLEP